MSSFLKLGGLEAGLKYVTAFGRLLVWAHRTDNRPAMDLLVHIEAVFLQEIADESGDIKHTAEMALIEYLITGKHDPTQGSRHEMQGALAKYQTDANTWWASQS